MVEKEMIEQRSRRFRSQPFDRGHRRRFLSKPSMNDPTPTHNERATT